MYVSVHERKYWVEEEGEGSPLILLHGFTGSTRTFDEMMNYLSGSYRVIRIDLPGHAKTGPVGVLTMERFCRDLTGILDVLRLESITILGYSLGGRTALSFSMLYPERVGKVLLESASPGLRSSKQQLARQAKDEGLANKIRVEGLETFVSYWEGLPLFNSQVSLSDEMKQTIRNERLRQSPVGLTESLLGMGTGKQPSWWDQLSSMTTDVLLITGAKDLKFHEINYQMSRELPNAQWVQVEDAGHAIHVEKPRVFAKIVDDFMIQ